jgi:hypothetical protein
MNTVTKKVDVFDAFFVRRFNLGHQPSSIARRRRCPPATQHQSSGMA